MNNPIPPVPPGAPHSSSPVAPPPQAPPPAPPADPSPEAQKKITIIEDEMMLQTALSDMLTAEGYQVSAASDGAQGLATIKSVHPDLILLDINMPIMDGITMLKMVRQDPQFTRMKIIMLTNYNDASKMSDVMNMNVDKYIVKADIKLEEISQLVHFLLFGPL